MKKMLIAVFMLLIVGFCVIGLATSDHQQDANNASHGDREGITTGSHSNNTPFPYCSLHSNLAYRT
ncbi:hypothetical protein P5G51_002660 [Virgibacillus sp. 179-BFC.A HS]|uniref:Uncharacterized protein n=1 Tax=Tigheibacillus jepli TaxID=3035914 RepID=A0ABU5CEM6_9BACI|nr:hypothetical protein [Virgibacillus sp. 179-BFC.A HS]MDY0404456.1 hypothetical protein [Virgibacillus sp. 179-BFC.A HS]